MSSPALLLLIVTLLISGNAVARERGLYEPGIWNGASWGYSGDMTPDKWGTLSDENSVCATGTQQSPVDISEWKTVRQPHISFRYRSSLLSGTHTGNGLWISYQPGSYLRIGRKEYELLGMAFHTPAEHRIEGGVASMSVHLHHRDARGNLLILAVPVITARRHNAMLTRILNYMPRNSGSRIHRRRVGINATLLLPTNKHYFSYMGSLSTPPCTEGVEWFVFDNPIRATVSNISKFRQIIGNNVRPIQPLNGRIVLGGDR